jgi:hypothetical protein
MWRHVSIGYMGVLFWGIYSLTLTTNLRNSCLTVTTT